MIPPEMGQSLLVGLLQSLQILMPVSLAHPLKGAQKFSMSGGKVRRLRRQNREKSDLKKLMRLFFFCRRRMRLKLPPNLTILFPRPS